MRVLSSIVALCLFAPIATSRQPIFRYLQVGSRRVPFETEKGGVPFTSVAKILGAIQQKGAEAPDTPTICYLLTGPAPRMVLVFYGDDMGGDALTDFELVPSSTRPALVGKCAWMNVPATNVATDRGVRLNLGRADVDAKLGKGRGSDDGTVAYEAVEERTIRLTAGSVSHARIRSGITVTYRHGKVVAFRGGISDEDDED